VLAADPGDAAVSHDAVPPLPVFAEIQPLSGRLLSTIPSDWRPSSHSARSGADRICLQHLGISEQPKNTVGVPGLGYGRHPRKVALIVLITERSAPSFS
jgi:hypothetical protein